MVPSGGPDGAKQSHHALKQIIMLSSKTGRPELKELLAKDEFFWKIKVEDFVSGIIFPHDQLDCDGSGGSHLFIEINRVAGKRANQ